jgi:hypothetical protein
MKFVILTSHAGPEHSQGKASLTLDGEIIMAEEKDVLPPALPRDEYGHLPVMVHFIHAEDGGAAYQAHLQKIGKASPEFPKTAPPMQAPPPPTAEKK